MMVRKTVNIDDELWKLFERLAFEKFGIYGAIKKAINAAIKEWVEKHGGN
jgi:hypothetical protein